MKEGILMNYKKVDETVRTRNWCGIIYPDSAPENWREILEENIIVGTFVSPLHHGWSGSELDEDKKDHYHIIMMFSGVKKHAQVKEIFDVIGVVMIQPIDDMRKMCRYLIHLDHPNKEQFKGDYESLISCYCETFDTWLNYIEMPAEKLDVIGEMLDFIDSNSIISFYELLRYAQYNNKYWFKSLTSNSAYVISQAIKSKNWLDNQNYESSEQ